jgi:hypothetical protein
MYPKNTELLLDCQKELGEMDSDTFGLIRIGSDE